MMAKNNDLNNSVCEVMQWINGNAYFSSLAYQKTHLLHHKLKVDVIEFDYGKFFRAHPVILKTIQGTEFLYIPTFYFFTRFHLYDEIFRKGIQHEKKRLQTMLLIRWCLLMLAFLINPLFLFYYFIALTLFIHVTRFVDAFQHDYLEIQRESVESTLPKKRHYEMVHTFNSPFSDEIFHKVFFLNFVYHRAHHAIMTCPWYLLPELHTQLFTKTDDRYNVSFLAGILNYHRYRVERLTSNEGVAMNHGKLNMTTFYGAISDRTVG